MDNFIYYNPCKIYFGKGEIVKLKTAIAQHKKILMLYGGGSIKRNGIYEKVCDTLKSHYFLEFGGIEVNPEYKTCMSVVNFIKENDLDFILAVGGGSVIDAAKFIAVACKYSGNDPWDIISKELDVKEALPIGSVLTLAATGSEMNANSVISRSELKQKSSFCHDKMFPQFSILDPEFTYTLPKKQIANGVVDAFVHVMEQYLTYPQKALLNDRFAEGILLTLIECGPKLLKDPKDYNAYANFMWSTSLALNTLISKGVVTDWATHIIGHQLTAIHGLDHAQTLAIILPHIMQYKRKEKSAKLIQYAERVWQIDKNLSIEQKINLAITKTINFFEQIGNPVKISAYNLTESTNINQIIANLQAKNYTALGENQDIKLTDVRKILEMSE